MTEEPPVRLVAVGDIMLGRGVKAAPVCDALNLLSPSLALALSGDIVTGNLECLIGSSGKPNPISHSHFQGEPAFSRSLLRSFDVVTMANNHVGDFGDEAVGETLAWLEQFGVSTVGIGRNTAEAVEPETFDIRGCKIAIFGATTVGTLLTSGEYILAEPGSDLYSRGREFSQNGYQCILHLHAGGGDVRHPSPATRSLLNEAADEAFNLVLGHHPHVAQGFVAQSRRTVFYSLGDFVFDKCTEGRDKALMVHVDLSSDGTLSDPDVRVVKRAPDLSLGLLNGEELEGERRVLRYLSDMIRSGESDKVYLNWRGSRLERLRKSIVFDWRIGGLQALKAKIKRVNRRKIRELIFGR